MSERVEYVSPEDSPLCELDGWRGLQGQTAVATGRQTEIYASVSLESSRCEGINGRHILPSNSPLRMVAEAPSRSQPTSPNPSTLVSATTVTAIQS